MEFLAGRLSSLVPFPSQSSPHSSSLTALQYPIHKMVLLDVFLYEFFRFLLDGFSLLNYFVLDGYGSCRCKSDLFHHRIVYLTSCQCLFTLLRRVSSIFIQHSTSLSYRPGMHHHKFSKLTHETSNPAKASHCIAGTKESNPSSRLKQIQGQFYRISK